MDPVTLKLVAGPLIESALREDANAGDLSTRAVAPEARRARVQLICKQDGIVAGLDVFAYTFDLIDPTTTCTFFSADGDAVKAGQVVGELEGDVRALLSAERTALNFLQRMSGIATATRRIADLLEGSNTVLVDTRKTTPNMRIFEKEAVREGGGSNHRYNLSGGVMLKDNHIATAGGIANAVAAARRISPFGMKVEVEAENLDMVRQALDAGADIIMFDNMSHDEMKAAVALVGGRALTECSGNVTEANAADVAGLGVDYVSCGAITHSAPILDFSMKNLQIEGVQTREGQTRCSR